jgi:FAD/FMN-containing dehydrogenase
MKLKPSSIKDLQTALQNPQSPIEEVDLSALNQLIEHVPEDMIATVQAGMTLGNFQTELSKQSQWLPVDPPDTAVSISKLLDRNLNGPRRFGYGTLRDWLVGISVVLPDGRLIHNGSKVVKNVAGFDLCKLFIGARGSLGVIVEAIFKLSPRPEKEVFLRKQLSSLEDADEMIGAVWNSNLSPSVLDLHQIDGRPLTLMLGLSGIAADVDKQAELARSFGLNVEAELEYDKVICAGNISTLSILPSRLIQHLKDLAPPSFVARAGNGIIYVPCSDKPLTRKPSALEKRIKESFDANGMFPCYEPH